MEISDHQELVAMTKAEDALAESCFNIVKFLCEFLIERIKSVVIENCDLLRNGIESSKLVFFR